MAEHPSKHFSVFDSSQEMRVSNARYRRQFESASVGVLQVDAETHLIEAASPYFINLTGYEQTELLKMKLWDIVAVADRARQIKFYADLQNTGYARQDDLALKTRSGTLINVELVCNIYDCDGNDVIQCNVHDTSSRKRNEAQLRRHADLYAALSAVNKAIVHCDNEVDLYLHICCAVVEFGGAKMAWVGIIDHESAVVAQIASFGDEYGYLDNIEISMEPGSALAQGPTATAIRENRPYWCNDFMHDPATGPWRKQARKSGWQASASIPLHKDDVVIGAIILYSAEINAFDEIVRELLIDIASDISFALDNIARESHRKHTEDLLRESEHKLLSIYEGARDGILVADKITGQFVDANPAICKMLGYSSEELLQLGVPDIHEEDDIPRQKEQFEQLVRGEINISRNVPCKRKDGSIFYANITSSPIRHSNRDCMMGIFRDVTERKIAEEEIRFKNSFLETLQETSFDGILVTDQEGRILSHNQRFIQIWKLPPQLVSKDQSKSVLEAALAQVENPEDFVTRVQYLEEHLDTENHVEILLKDGRTLDRYSAPVIMFDGLHYGRVWYFRDVTEQKKANQKFQSLLEATPDAMVIVDQNSKITLVNAQTAVLTGWSREELLGQNIDLLVPDQFHGSHRHYMKQYFERPRSTMMGNVRELCVKHKDGRTIPVEIDLSPLQVDGSTVVISTIRDITQRKQAEDALRDSEERFRTMFLEAPMGIALIDSHTGQICETNPVFAEIAGRSMDEMLELDWQQITHPDDIQADMDNMAQLNAGKIPGFQMEKRYIRPDGNVVWIDMTVSALKSEDKGHPCHLCMIKDITQTKAAEARVARFNRIYGVLSGINSTIIHAHEREELFDEACRIAVEQGKFAFAWIGIYDTDAKLVVPTSCAVIDKENLEPIDKSRIPDNHDESANCRRLTTYVASHKAPVFCNDITLDDRLSKSCADSLVRGYRSVALLPLVIGDKPAGLFVLYSKEINIFDTEEIQLLNEMAENISFAMEYFEAQSALVKLNEDLESKVALRTTDLEKARRDAEEANQAKSAFLATMSHEIRTPMNGVIGMIDVLHQTSLKGYQVDMINLISESAHSLLDIIEDILDLSKIEAGKLDIESDPITLADVVESACTLLSHLAIHKGVELTQFVDPAIPHTVMGDALRLRQILVNLINNAIKFSSGMDKPGSVSVRAVMNKHNGGRLNVVFQVSDNGIGMNDETLLNLFTAFTQADTATTRRYGGSGLGLAISHHLVGLMGGTIDVQSEPGEGSTFTVSLPFTPSNSSTMSDKYVDLSGLSCVVLGDPDSMADDLAAYLSYSDAIVNRATNVDMACEYIYSFPPGDCLCVIDAREDITLPLEKLRAACGERTDLEPHFVVVEHGRYQVTTDDGTMTKTIAGQRRHARMKSGDLATLDSSMHHRSFMRAVAIAIGQATEQRAENSHAGKLEAITPPSREDAIEQGRLILVAEDNETNQKVIRYQLALLGYTADFSSHGREALDRIASADYALLFTDLHMPEMDGYDLATNIRASETEERHIPIIALTANALKDEAEHCRSVGMDDYLSKPTRLDDLKAMLEKWMPAAPESTQEQPDVQETAAVDINVLAELVQNDHQAIQELLHDFQLIAATIYNELVSAFEGGKIKTLADAAHKLKSSARSVGALRLGALCEEIEKAGKAGQIDVLNELLPCFEAEMAKVNQYLDSL